MAKDNALSLELSLLHENNILASSKLFEPLDHCFMESLGPEVFYTHFHLNRAFTIKISI